MYYSEMRRVARTGDKIICRSPGIIGAIIMMVMRDSESHVAVLEWDRPDHQSLFIREMVENKGAQFDYARFWCLRRWKKKQILQFVAAPDIVTRDEAKATAWLRTMRFMEQKYGYLTLPLVFLVSLDKKGKIMPKLAKLFRIDPNRLNAVCSVWAQRFDQAMGYDDFEAPLVGPGAFGRYRNGRGVFRLEPDPEMLQYLA